MARRGSLPRTYVEVVGIVGLAQWVAQAEVVGQFDGREPIVLMAIEGNDEKRQHQHRDAHSRGLMNPVPGVLVNVHGVPLGWTA